MSTVEDEDCQWEMWRRWIDRNSDVKWCEECRRRSRVDWEVLRTDKNLDFWLCFSGIKGRIAAVSNEKVYLISTFINEKKILLEQAHSRLSQTWQLGFSTFVLPLTPRAVWVEKFDVNEGLLEAPIVRTTEPEVCLRYTRPGKKMLSTSAAKGSTI